MVAPVESPINGEALSGLPSSTPTIETYVTILRSHPSTAFKLRPRRSALQSDLALSFHCITADTNPIHNSPLKHVRRRCIGLASPTSPTYAERAILCFLRGSHITHLPCPYKVCAAGMGPRDICFRAASLRTSGRILDWSHEARSLCILPKSTCFRS